MRHLLGGRPHQHDGAGDDGLGFGAGGTIHEPGRYDALHRLLFFGQRGAAYAELAALAGIRAGDRVLDLGCGTGEFTRAAADLAGPTGHVLGVDLAEEMVAYARAQGTDRRARPEYAVMDAGALTEPDASYDVVVTALALHHLAEATRDRAMAEAHRVLRPGGHLLVAEFRPPPNPALEKIVHAVLGTSMAHDPTTEVLHRIQAAHFDVVASRYPRPMLTCVLARKPQ